MQKSNEKKILGTVPKKLQRVETFWDCPEFSKGKNRGITLIALIITIIVMLILVGVTINVALNGGLFEKAENATKATEEKAILEEMLVMMELDDNGKFKPDEIIGNMRTKHPEYKIDDSNKPNIIIKGNLGTYNYIVSETEIKIGTKEIKPFDWEDVGLNVDIDTDYKFYDSIFSTTYVINFTKEGELVLKADGAMVGSYSAKEYIKDKKLTIPFTYAGNTYDTTLTMNTNNIDVDAELPRLTTVTYVKIEQETYPVAYKGKYNVLGNICDTIIIEAYNEVYVWFANFSFGEKNSIIQCNDVTQFFTNSNQVLRNEYDIEYSRVALSEEGYPRMVYSDSDRTWYFVMWNTNTGIEAPSEIKGDSPIRLTSDITEEEVNTIITSINNNVTQ